MAHGHRLKIIQMLKKREKYKILRQAGFSKEESKKLMQDGVAGLKDWFQRRRLKPGDVAIQSDGSTTLMFEGMHPNGKIIKWTEEIGGDVSIPGSGLFADTAKAHRINAKIVAINGDQVKVAVKDFTGKERYRTFSVKDLDAAMTESTSDFGFLKDETVSLYHNGSDVNVKIHKIYDDHTVDVEIPFGVNQAVIRRISIDDLSRRPETVQPCDCFICKKQWREMEWNCY